MRHVCNALKRLAGITGNSVNYNHLIPYTETMEIKLSIRRVAVIAAMLSVPSPAFAQEAPSRISWAPSYSGSCVDCSLTGRNMSGWNVSNARYQGADLTAAILHRAQGHGANFDEAQATGADLRLGDFTGASFEDAILVGARLQHAVFNSGKMAGTVLTGANLSDGKFIGTTLTGAHLQSATVHNTDFSAATLAEANLVGADLTGSVFDNAVLTNANLTGATITDSSFKDVRFSGAVLERLVGVETADFEGACASEDSQLPMGLSLPDCAEY